MSKALEELKRIRQETCPATYMQDFDKEKSCDIIEKELKALEIIKRVYTDLCFILSYDTFEEYDNTCNLINTSVNLKRVNKEEFEILKEVFK